MFEGLDDIDWARSGCHLAVGMKSADIPKSIRNLLSDDAETREYAIHDLFGEGQHFGMTGEATPFIIPFVLEALRLDTFPDKAFVLDALNTTCRQIKGATTIRQMREVIGVHDVVVTGFDDYLKLLHDTDIEVRSACLRLLRRMQEQSIAVFEAITARFKVEPEPRIRAEIIRVMFKVWNDLGYLDFYIPSEYDPYKQFLSAVALKDVDIDVRLEAAITLFQLPSVDRHYNTEVHKNVGEVFADAENGYQPNTDYKPYLMKYKARRMPLY